MNRHLVLNWLNKTRSARKHALSGLVIFSGFVLSGCVSSTQDTKSVATPQNTQPLALSEEAQKAQHLRSLAVEEIHQKARAAPVNEAAPAYGVPRQGETELLTPEEVTAKTEQLNATTQEANAQIPDEEITRKHKKMQELRRKGNRHYKDAVNKIGTE